MGIFEGIKKAFSSDDTVSDNWDQLSEEDDLDRLLEQSKQKPQLIYKHSARCSVCLFAKSELESSAEEIGAKADMNFVDVIHSRGISNKIAEVLNIRHESPQAIIVENGKPVWSESHGSIKAPKVLEQL